MPTLRCCFGVLALALPSSSAAGTVCSPQNLQVEYATNPQGVDYSGSPPRFSFSLCSDADTRDVVQTHYDITVYELLPNGTTVKPPAWESGPVASNSSTNIPYPTTGAATLKSNTDYAWLVSTTATVEGGAAQTSPSSDMATFSTGVTYPHDWKGATWIGHADANVAHVLLRTPFTIPEGKQVTRAVAFVVGLGYYKLHVDGKQVSTHELGAFTTFEKRVLYDTYDCLDAILQGSGTSTHTLAVELGPGFYSQSSVHVGQPVLLARLSLHFADGSTADVVSSSSGDSDWEVATGPITSADIYAGESFDARQDLPGWNSGADAGNWTKPQALTEPAEGVLVTSHSVMPRIGIRQSFSPCDMWQSAPGVYVFDFCQNMAGYTILHIPRGADTPEYAGTTVSILHAEAIHGPPPAPIFHHYRNTLETNNYTLAGLGEQITYTPRFVYMGFRYAQIIGYPGTPDFESLSAVFVNTMYDEAGSISFSDPNLNAVQHITRTAAMSNFQSIPTDCPQRERRGWLGDAQLSSETNMYNFNMAGAYSNFVALIDDAQDPLTNATQDCVPWYNHGHQPADPAWGSAYTFLANHVAEYYKDDRIFADHYDGIKGHLDSLRAEASIDNMDGLLTFSWWGDWCPPAGCRADRAHHNSALVASFEYLMQLRMVARYASIIGHAEDAKLYSSVAQNVSTEFVNHFFDASTNTFVEPGRSPGAEDLTLQTRISLASTLGLIPSEHSAAVFDNLVNDIVHSNGGHLNAGIVGIKELLPALCDGGRVDVALLVSQIDTEPGWVYMVQQGATTLWETWTGSRYQPVASWNHIMFGSQSAWYFKYLAGLRLAPGTRGWESIEFRPHVWAGAASPPHSICSNLSSVEASLVTIRGPVEASWGCDAFDLCQSVEENEDATFSCPPGSVIKSVDFASFGTPTGDCQSHNLAINTSCHANASKSVLENLCLGKPSCSFTVQDKVFLQDPCQNVKKTLAAHMTCGASGSQPIHVFQYNITVPVGSTGSVLLPTFGSDVTSESFGIQEGGADIWKGGKFVAGTSGVHGASAEKDATGVNVRVSVGSGSYNFDIFK